jgi:lipoprotein NlpI
VRLVALLVMVLVLGAEGAEGRQSPQDIADQAERDFAAGRIEASVANYDRLAALVPDVAPVLWQRGIGLYYLGRYKECAAQFASHHKVNPTDLENAAWHFFCLARAESPERARAAMLAAGPDRRAARTAIYEMLRGDLAPDDLLAEAAETTPTSQFYVHLYVALYAEVMGEPAIAREHLALAASERYALIGGFMNTVARVHLARLGR